MADGLFTPDEVLVFKRAMLVFGDPGVGLNEFDKSLARTVVPVGTKCDYCKELIADHEQGVLVPLNRGDCPFHLECFRRRLYGSIGHQNKRCMCYRGPEEDPPGMTLRQGAKAASDYVWVVDKDYPIEKNICYQNKKNEKWYKVAGFAKHSETLEVLVLYQVMVGTELEREQVWARPLDIFLTKFWVYSREFEKRIADAFPLPDHP